MVAGSAGEQGKGIALWVNQCEKATRMDDKEIALLIECFIIVQKDM